MTLITKTLLIIGGVLLILGVFQKNSNFLNVHTIIIKHIAIFRGNLFQGIAVFIAPALIAISIAMSKTITVSTINSVVVVLSIFSALFFAELSALCTLPNSDKDEKYRQLLKETFNSVLFEILISIVVLIIAFIMLFLDNYENLIVVKVVSAIIYYLTIELILNELVLIKRIKALFLH